MTKRKRILSVIMAVAMVASMMFAMTANTYANTDNAMTVTVECYNMTDYGAPVAEYFEVTIDPDNFTRVYEIPANVSSDVITDAKTPTVMDAVAQALKLQNSDIPWDLPEGETNYIGGYLPTICGLSTQTAADSSSTVWRGYAWMYSLDFYTAETPSFTDLYATNVPLEDGMNIVWTYDYREQPIPGTH